jgi:hypothetical protein
MNNVRFFFSGYLLNTFLLCCAAVSSCSTSQPTALRLAETVPDQPSLITSPQEAELSVVADPAFSANVSLEIDMSTCPRYSSIWRRETDGAEKGNFLSEESGVYWTAILPLLSMPGNYYEVRGSYVDARLFSFQTYNNLGAPIDVLVDYQIDPNADSSSPFRKFGRGNGQRNHYTILLSPDFLRPWSRPATNKLYLGNTDSFSVPSNYILLYRVYDGRLTGVPIPPQYVDDPRQWEKQGQRELPHIYYVVRPGAQAQYPTLEQLCSQIQGEALSVQVRTDKAIEALANAIREREPSGGQLASNTTQWFVGFNAFSSIPLLFSNYPLISDVLTDQLLDSNLTETQPLPNAVSSYLAAFLNSHYGEVNVTRFRAPTFPNTDAGEDINPGIQQVRFWSICVHNPFLLYTVDCLQDYEFGIDEDGFVTIIFSWPSDRPVDPKTGSLVQNWLPYTSSATMVFYRHMLPSPIFLRSHFYYSAVCEQNGFDCLQNYDSISKWMRDFYPVSYYCTRNEFELNQCDP